MKNTTVVSKVIFLFTIFLCPRVFAVDLNNFIPERVELLIADSSTHAFESFFGHSALLLIPEGQTWRNGIVIDFVANFKNIEGPQINYYYKGITGKVPFAVQGQSSEAYFYSKIVEETRNVERLPIPMTRDQKIKLWAEIQNLANRPEKLGSYVFHLKNCASAILLLLKRSGLSINYNQIFYRSMTSGISPKQLTSFLRTALITPFPPKTALAIATQVKVVEKKHKIKLRSIYNKEEKTYAPWTLEELSVLQKMSLEELVLAIQFITIFDGPRSHPIQDLIAKSGKRIRTRFLDLHEWPISFYSICETSDCSSSLQRDLISFYDRDELRKLYILNYPDQQRSTQLFAPEIDSKTSPQAQYWATLTRYLSHFYRKTKD